MYGPKAGTFLEIAGLHKALDKFPSRRALFIPRFSSAYMFTE